MKLKRLLPAFLLFYFLPAFAYKKEGHEAIEKRAYQLLDSPPAQDGLPSGKVMLQYLRDSGYLDTDGLVHSAYPDISFERQFAQNRQMYHFMAADANVIKASADAPVDVQRHRLLVPSLNDCLQMMYFFAKETLDNPVGASQAGRGTYVLMHIVEDSYSSEHADRDADAEKLLTIKGWELSRRDWPDSAKALNTDRSMRMLHHAFNSPGDEAWTGNYHGLSKLADAAARNVADLLVTLYIAAHDQDKADDLLKDYLAKWYAPAGGIRGPHYFTFTGNSDSVRYDYSGEYELHPAFVAFAYDRSPFFSLMATGSTGFQNAHPLSAYGLEFQWFFRLPGPADNKKVFFERLPLVAGLSLNSVQRGNYSYADNLLLKGFLKTGLMAPIINKTIEPFVGVSAFPGPQAHHLNTIAGLDLSWNLGKDWTVHGNHSAVRLCFGYELDFSGYPATHNLVLKLGFNTFGSRVVNKHNRKVKNPKK